MLNLYEIMQAAQGGQALDNLANQFNLTTGEAHEAVKAILPVLSQQLLKQTSEPSELGSFLGALGESQHLAAFSDPAAAQAATQTADSLNQILGSRSAREEIVLRASSETGLSQDVLSRMLPVIASMIFGGLAKSMQEQGLGGILGQLASAAGQGGLGSILGQILGGAAAPAGSQPPPAPAPGPASRQGGLGGILGKILDAARGAAPQQPQQTQPGPAGPVGGILGSILASLTRRGGASPDSGPAAGFPPPASTPHAPGLDSASILAGLEALTKMLQPGTPPPAASGLTAPPPPVPSGGIDINAELDRITGRKRE